MEFRNHKCKMQNIIFSLKEHPRVAKYYRIILTYIKNKKKINEKSLVNSYIYLNKMPLSLNITNAKTHFNVSSIKRFLP